MKGKEVVFSNEIQQGTKLRQSIKGQLESVNARLSSLEDDYARYQGGLESISAKIRKYKPSIKRLSRLKIGLPNFLPDVLLCLPLYRKYTI